MKIVRDKRLEGGRRRGRRGWRGTERLEESEEGREVGRGRPRTRRIIARVISPSRCARARGSPFLFPYLSALPSSCLALSASCVRTVRYIHARVSICMREKPERKEILVARGMGGRGGRERRGEGGG